MDENDFTVTDESDGQPVQAQPSAQAPDVASIVAQTTEAIMAKLAPMFQQRSEPQQPAKQATTRDKMLSALKQSLGLDDDEAEEYARAGAYSLVEDEYEDDAVRKGLRQRINGARPIESLAAMRREQREFMQKIEGRFAEQENARKRADEAAAYKRLASEGQLSAKFPNLFRKGRPSQAALKIFDKFHDVEQLRSALEVAEEIAAEQQPRKPSLGAGMGGGHATRAPKPSKFLSGTDYDNEIRRIYEEMN